MLVYQNIPKLQNLLKNPYKFKLIFSYSTWRATDIQLSQESDLYDTFWRAHFCIYYVMPSSYVMLILLVSVLFPKLVMHRPWVPITVYTSSLGL